MFETRPRNNPPAMNRGRTRARCQNLFDAIGRQEIARYEHEE
jgi:hypothetical protein